MTDIIFMHFESVREARNKYPFFYHSLIKNFTRTEGKSKTSQGIHFFIIIIYTEVPSVKRK